MKRIKTIMKVLFASSLLLPFAAGATHPDCDISLDLVATAIQEAPFVESSRPNGKPGSGKTSNQGNLLVKLEDAAVKLAMHKYDRASTKLSDISDKATEWYNADKQKLENATGINTAVTNAIVCIYGMAEPED